MKYAALLFLVTTFVHAQGGIVDVAKCTIEANNRLPYGQQLNHEIKECYRTILPAHAWESIYNARHSTGADVTIDIYIEVQNGATTRARGPVLLPHYHGENGALRGAVPARAHPLQHTK